MSFSGVFERYPKLQIGTMEHELSWIAHFLDRIDYTYTQRVQEECYRFKEAMLPSDYFHRNVFAGFQEDVMGGVARATWIRGTVTRSAVRDAIQTAKVETLQGTISFDQYGDIALGLDPNDTRAAIAKS